MSNSKLNDEAGNFYDEIHAEAVHLAGGLKDLPQRAMVYHRIFATSGGNFSFALIAAHGALWAHWYLVAARCAAFVLAILDVFSPLTRKQKCAAFDAYVDSLQDINRRVMIETYTAFHFTRRYGRHPLIRAIIPEALLDQIIGCHHLADTGVVMTTAQMRRSYEDFFRWEQVRVVGPAVEEAMAQFNWPLMRTLCLRPWVWFSYFRFGRSLNFRDFSSAEERVEKGLAAFDLGAGKGWDRIERNLLKSPFMPHGFAEGPVACFEDLRKKRRLGSLSQGLITTTACRPEIGLIQQP